MEIEWLEQGGRIINTILKTLKKSLKDIGAMSLSL